MSLDSDEFSKSHSGNGVTIDFAFPYKFLSSSDLQVVLINDSTGVETPWVEDTDYSVYGAGDESGGGVIVMTAPASGYTLKITREVELTQGLELTPNGQLPSASLENALDRLTMMSQQIAGKANRAVLTPEAYAATFDPTLPTPTAGKTIIFNSGATAFTLGPTSDDVANAQGYASTASSAQTAAEAAQTAAESAQTAAEVARDEVIDTKIVWKGGWDSGTAYAVNDAVTNDGASYICIQAHTNQEPPNATYWDVLAERGAAGAGTGDVVGPASSTNNGFARYGDTTGKLLINGNATIGAADLSSSAVTTAKIADSNVTTAKILAKNITLAKLADGTPGGVLAWDASGEAEDIGAGTSGQILRSSGNTVGWQGLDLRDYVYAPSTVPIVSGGPATFTHGLGGVPVSVMPTIVCQTDEAGYTAGDELIVNFASNSSTAGIYQSVKITSTQIIIRFASFTSVMLYVNGTTGNYVPLTNANWEFRVRAV